MKQKAFLLLFIFYIAVLNGCGLAAKGLTDTVRGGISDPIIIENVQDLHLYDSIEVIPFTSVVGVKLSTELLAYLNGKVTMYNSERNEGLNKERQFKLHGKMLYLTDDVYRKQILIQLKFNDSTTGDSLGMINVMGHANCFRGLTAVLDSLVDCVDEILTENHFYWTRDS